MRIIRHELPIIDTQIVTLPAAGNLLSVAKSRTSPDLFIDLWSVDYMSGEPTAVDIHIVGTGNPILDDPTREAVALGRFLGSVVTPSWLVWHVFQGLIHS